MGKRVTLSKAEKEHLNINKILDTDIEDMLEGDIENTILQLQEWQEQYKQYDSIHIDSEYFGDYTSWRLIGFRRENDNEYTKRIDRLKAAKRKRIFKEEEQERKMLAALLKKYGEPDTRNKPSKEELGLV